MDDKINPVPQEFLRAYHHTGVLKMDSLAWTNINITARYKNVTYPIDVKLALKTSK